MEEYPALWNVSVDSVYLDTTYCKEQHDFPSQSDVIERTKELVREHLDEAAERGGKKTLIAVGSYTIGKERIFLALAEMLGCNVWANAEKTRVLKAIRDPRIENRLVKSPNSAQVHVTDMRTARNPASLAQYLDMLNGRFDHVLAVVPTGWTHTGSAGSARGGGVAGLRIRKAGQKVSKLEVPYSEHSSFSELRRFIRFLRLKSADKVIPTVNVGSAESRAEMKRYFKQWIEGAPSPTKSGTKDIGTFFKKL